MTQSINLITCMKFFKSILKNATEFAAESARNPIKIKKNTKSLDELKSIRNNFCQILWMKSILTELTEQVDGALEVYDNTIRPIVENVSELTNDDVNSDTIYDMWNLSYHSSIPPPKELTKSWADMTEYDDICRHIKAMKDAGYPDCNNIQPIKDFRSESDVQIEQKYSFQNADVKETRYYNYEISGHKIKLPIIEELQDLPPCFYYFRGSRSHRRGVYMSPAQGFVMQVPEVTIVPYSVENANYYSVKCAQGKTCKNYRCTYAHPGTNYVKIGCVSRCPTVHSFGNKDTLADDLKSVTLEDVRIVSMYGLNDLFSAALWFARREPEGVTQILSDLEVCDDYNSEFNASGSYNG